MDQARSKKKSDQIAANFTFMPKNVEPITTNLVAFLHLNRNYSFIKSKTDPLNVTQYKNWI